MKLLIWDGCFTVTLTPLRRMSFNCSAPYWYETNYMILKACNWNITSKVTPVFNEKINLVTFGLSFQGLPPFLSRDILAKCT